jgi:hypothetical protein
MPSQIKKVRCLGLDDTQAKLIMPKDLPEKAEGIEDPQIKRLIEKIIEAKNEKKDSLDAKMWGYSSFDSSALYDVFDFRVSRHTDGPDEILGGYQGHVMADCYSGNMSVDSAWVEDDSDGMRGHRSGASRSRTSFTEVRQSWVRRQL